MLVREVSWATFFRARQIFFRSSTFSFFAKTVNVYNSKTTKPIEPKITHNIRVSPVSILGNIVFAPVQYFRDDRPFSFFAKTFNVYNSKNTEPIKLKFTYNMRVGPRSVLVNFLFAPVQYIRDHRPFSCFAKFLTFITRKILNRLS